MTVSYTHLDVYKIQLNNAFAQGDSGKDTVKTYADLLYNQAVLISGLSVEDPVTFAKEICSLITR